MRVRFVHTMANVDMQAPMKTPRRIDDKDSWYKAARKAIPQIPEFGVDGWSLKQYRPSLNNVVFFLEKPMQSSESIRGVKFDFCTVVIDRKASSLG